MSHELARLDATAQAALVRSGELTPLDLVEAGISRIEKCNPQLNAVISPLFEKAREVAAALARESESDTPAPFRGVPMLLKDLGCHSAGDPYHCGMQFLKDRDWREDDDTILAGRFRAAGFVFLGKTNTPELGCLTTTEPVAYGPTRNPWNSAHSCGGSSGGSAAAVASGMVPVAHAGDGGGSIRIPASECGLVGLKPTRARVSLGPRVGDSWAGLVTQHVVTRSVRDTAAVLDAVAGSHPGDPYVAPAPARSFIEEVGSPPGVLRIGLLRGFRGEHIAVHPDCVSAVDEAGRLLESLGHRVEEAAPTVFEDSRAIAGMAAVVTSWTSRDLAYWSERTGAEIGPEDVEPMTWQLAEQGRQLSAPAYLAAIQGIHAWAREMAAWWEGGFDLLLSPTLAEPPPLLGEFDATPDAPMRGFMRSASFAAFTSAFNLTGQPAISLPLCTNEASLPIGVQLAAAFGREDILLRVSSQIEEVRPWMHRRPPVHA
jgi:amidase